VTLCKSGGFEKHCNQSREHRTATHVPPVQCKEGRVCRCGANERQCQRGAPTSALEQLPSISLYFQGRGGTCSDGWCTIRCSPGSPPPLPSCSTLAFGCHQVEFCFPSHCPPSTARFQPGAHVKGESFARSRRLGVGGGAILILFRSSVISLVDARNHLNGRRCRIAAASRAGHP
jgi:hypothetical protein